MENDILSLLIGPQSVEDFERKYWGKCPALFEASPHRKKLFSGLFSLERFEEIVRDGNGTLKFGNDILTGRYRNGVRERPTPILCDVTAVRNLFGSGCTLQMVQPQRFLPQLQEICVRLESIMGCLVGCNAYLTPQNTQGLAPHHDDVELFVCQTQGSKRWRLYEPRAGFVLPNVPSEDLDQEELGSLIKEVQLHEGDVLYMPKGIIHQAKAQDQCSVHLTISTYHRWSWGDLLSTLISDTLVASQEPVCLPSSLREELPLGFVKKIGRDVGSKQDHKIACKALADKVRALADDIEKKAEIVESASDLMAYQFLNSRMPPPDSFLPQQENYPQLEDRIKIEDSSMFRLMPVFSKDGKIVEGVIQIVSCLKNDGQNHMMDISQAEDNKEEEEIIIFPLHQKDALLQIFAAEETGVCVKHLHLPNNEEKLKLAGTLWEEGVVFVV